MQRALLFGMSKSRSGVRGFEWRVGTGQWRWLLLGSLGVIANACADQGDAEPGVDPGVVPTSGGGVTNVVGPTHTNSATTSLCLHPTPLGGGWERCENGLAHRAQVGECSSELPRAQGIAQDVLDRYYPQAQANSADRVAAPDANPVATPGCVRDSDCTLHAYGHCEVGNGPEGNLVSCEYGCVVDADCEAGAVCLCGGPVGQCVPSTCTTDAQCGGNRLCATFEASPGCSYAAYACQTAKDECATNADCPSGQSCSIEEGSPSDGIRRCTKPEWVCGRPFLVEGAARLADVQTRADWYAELMRAAPAPALEAPELRAAVAQGWLDQARMEHASVAAFARFSLQLLSLGAPAELVAECAQAQADEVAHARACFALARRHLTRDVGPAPLSLGGVLQAADWREIVLGTLLEGCIGETLAALEAAEARAHCADAAACAVLERIAADETRHAQLAWRFVAWALETGPASLRDDVRECFAWELSEARASSPAADALEQQLLSHGLMGPGLRACLRQRVLREVIAPCAAALLGGAGPSVAERFSPLPEHTAV